MENFDLRIFSGIEKYFADFVISLTDGLNEEEKYHLWLATALLSHFVKKGHICIDLNELAGKTLHMGENHDTVSIKCPPLYTWLNTLKKSDVIGIFDEKKPIILTDKNRLYLNRYFYYERTLIEKITERLNTPSKEIDGSKFDEASGKLFPESSEDEEDLQKKAAMQAIKNNFFIISGGPGTGKTFTIFKILVLLIEMYKHHISIALAAPTGKAAARLKTLIRELKNKLNCSEETKLLIPEDVSTIHRLLGASYITKKFKFNEDNPLPHDVIILDEASMIDLPLMSKLFNSTKEDTKIILVGDKDQLSSVEPGAVFGDICDAAQDIPDSIVILKKNYRFGKESGIGTLSELVKKGRGEEAIGLLKKGDFKDIKWRDIDSYAQMEDMLEKYIINRYLTYIKAPSIEDAFTHFEEFHVLCALRHGPFGVIAINTLIEKILYEMGFINNLKRWYRGKPILITENDYSLKLYNGDIGIFFDDTENKNSLSVFFKTEDGLRRILPLRITDFETAYAITVHKSQGSEFQEIIFILSDSHSEIFTRELIYTAITRAKKSIEIWGREDVFVEAVERKIIRKSGIRDALISIHQNQGL